MITHHENRIHWAANQTSCHLHHSVWIKFPRAAFLITCPTSGAIWNKSLWKCSTASYTSNIKCYIPPKPCGALAALTLCHNQQVYFAGPAFSFFLSARLLFSPTPFFSVSFSLKSDSHLLENFQSVPFVSPCTFFSRAFLLIFLCWFCHILSLNLQNF